MFQNFATDTKSTNIFETLTGVLNVAPLKISGQYKFVVDLSGKLWLDDYNERRVEVDLTKEILPQIANFLKTKTNIVQKDYVRYGGFQHLTRKYWHIPLYLNVEKYNGDYSKDSLPKFFCISRALNEEIDSADKLQKFGLILQLYQLDKLGITSIMEEILSECPDYPIYHNFEDNNLNITGYSITEESWKTVTLNTVYYQANQPYFDVFNNFILNAYVENNMFFPRFLNFEFEFEYNDDLVVFNNFFGYMSKGLQTTVDEMTREIPSIQGDRNIPYFLCNIQDYDDYIVWKQEKYVENLAIEPYYVLVDNVNTIPSKEQQPQVRFRVNNISVNDTFIIRFPDGSPYFTYSVLTTDIKPDSLLKTMRYICKRMSKLSGYEFLFDVDDKLQVTCKSNIVGIEQEQYSISVPSQCYILDRYDSDENYYKFRAITQYDLMLSSTLPYDVSMYKLEIDGIEYKLVERFQFNNKNYVRCVGEDNAYPVIDKSHILEFYQRKESELWKLPELPYLSVNSNLESQEQQFEYEKYADELLKHFEFPDGYEPSDDEVENHKKFEIAVENFRASCDKQRLSDTPPYQKDDEQSMEMVPATTVEQENVNDDWTRTMLFNMFGSGSCLVPTIVNIDKHFSVINGNVNYNLAELSSYAYHWFLIHGKCPEYLKNDIRSLRYFESIPQLTSRIVRVNTFYCETMFLGVKYQLPLKYENWQFAVYLDPNNQLDIERNYRFEIDTVNHRLYLKIGYFIDYTDLIRGGEMKNEPLLDLSLFYGTKNSYNETSDFITGFVEAKLLLGNETTTVTTPANTQTNGWYYFDSSKPRFEGDTEYREGGLDITLIALKCSDPDIDLRDLFPVENEKQEFLLWSEIEYNGQTYTYVSAMFTVKGIVEIRENVVWCKDIQCKFFDTEEMFVQRYKLVKDEYLQEFFRVKRSTDVVVLSDDTPAGPPTYMYGDNVKQCLVMLNTSTGTEEASMRLLVPDKTLSLRDDYFELRREVFESDEQNGTWLHKDSIFTFEKTIVGYKSADVWADPEYRGWKYPDMNITEMFAKFGSESFEHITVSQRVTMFDRNQMWLFIQDYMGSDIRFKNVSKEQVRKQINNLLVGNLRDYCEINSVPVWRIDNVTDKDNTNSLGYVRLIVNDHDYNSVIWNIIEPNGANDKLITIDRYKTPGFPFMLVLKSAIEFQREKYADTNRIYNEYDTDFGGNGINATGLWDEVTGNVVSSLYCRSSDIRISIPFSEEINIRELLENYFTLDECVIDNNRNEDYISKLDENIDEYIIETYTKYVLNNFYELCDVTTQLGIKLGFWTDAKNSDIIHLQSQYSYSTDVETLTIRFVRKQ